MKAYVDGYELKDDEYMLKVRKNDKVGFLVKYNKDGSIPKAFRQWTDRYDYSKRECVECDLQITVHTEVFKSGWKIESWRFGKSQNWAKVIHPNGFKIEVYLSQLLEVIKNGDVVKGELQGEYKWEDHKLICKSTLTK